MLALMLTLPATLIGLVALLAITSGLERQLTRSVRPAPVRTGVKRLPAPVSTQS
ncbi:MAG TPA: hypothetical protein VMY88_04655 [Acidimicrobiales bacterium]|nr:hypothetical protein [Acidimicrobiales bacterium]